MWLPVEELEIPFSCVIYTAAFEFLATLPFFPRTNPTAPRPLAELRRRERRGWAAILSGSETLADTTATTFMDVPVQLHKTGSSSLDDLCQRYRS